MMINQQILPMLHTFIHSFEQSCFFNIMMHYIFNPISHNQINLFLFLQSKT